MYEYGKTLEQKLSSVEYHIFPTYYHTWGFPVLVIEDPLQVGLKRLTKWEPRERVGVYLGHYPFCSGSV